MTGLWIIIAAAAGVAAGFLAGQVLGYKAGHAAGRDTERTRHALQQLAAAGRARAAIRNAAAPDDEVPEWERDVLAKEAQRRAEDPYRELPPTPAPWPIYMAPGRSAVTAGDIKPVEVPEPRLTDTGELRRIADIGEAIRARLTG